MTNVWLFYPITKKEHLDLYEKVYVDQDIWGYENYFKYR